MPRTCQASGIRTRFGNQIARRGLPKSQGGVGLKTTGVTRRTFKPNLQTIRVVMPGGAIERVRLSTRAIKTGFILVQQGGKRVRVPLVKAPHGAARA
jgi:large subunit ribosomal protein L28